MKKEKLLPLPEPGAFLWSEFMRPLSLSSNQLARMIKVSPNRISDIVRGRRRISADTDCRLCIFFGLTEGYFLRMQEALEIQMAKEKLLEDEVVIMPYKYLRLRRSAPVPLVPKKKVTASRLSIRLIERNTV